MVSLDDLIRALAESPDPRRFGPPRVHTLYVSPLRALSHDIHRTLEEPLQELAREAHQAGIAWRPIEVGVRTGDTPAPARRAMARRPPHLLVTTPESLFLMLASPAMRPALSEIRRVIVDELHALAPTKRGAHLALSLEFLQHLAGRPIQRIGLSATQRPLQVMAAYLAGERAGEVAIVDVGARRDMDLQVMAPAADGSRPENPGVWPAIVDRLARLVEGHRSTLVFVNNRRQAERLTHQLNEAAGSRVALTHHGSLGKAARLAVERALKAGELKAVVATSSLELGIDVGSIDLVVHVESPGSVARGLQRVGRSGHALAARAKGRIIPTHPSDLLEAAAVARAMADFSIEPTRLPRAPLDVLAQHVAAAAVLRPWSEDELLAVVRRAHSFSPISREMLHKVLALLAAEVPAGGRMALRLRPRIDWDRSSGTIRARPSTRAVLYANAGTIPDRGTYPVVLSGTDIQLGELDEEFVYESRRGDRFWLGMAAWRIEEIRPERVVVTRAEPGPARMPFWRGEAPGRSAHVGRLVGELLERLEALLDDPPGLRRFLMEQCHLDETAAGSLLEYLSRQARACGWLPGAHRVGVEVFQDEAGDRRVAIHSPWGSAVNRAWGLAMLQWARERLGLEPDLMACDDGVLLRFAAEAQVDPQALVAVEGEDPERLVREAVVGTPLLARLFREAAARALLLPRNAPGRRLPLWQQRLRAADLMLAASIETGGGPLCALMEEAVREALEDVLDLPTFRDVMQAVRRGDIRVAVAQTRVPSSFAASLLFDFTAVYLYEPDAPKAERRAALLMGAPDDALLQAAQNGTLFHLIDPQAAQEVARDRRFPPWLRGRRPAGPEDLEDWLRYAGDLTEAEVADAAGEDREQWLTWMAGLEKAGRAVRLEALPGLRGRLREPLWVHPLWADLYRGALEAPSRAEAVDSPEAAEGVAALLQRRAPVWGAFGVEDVQHRYGLPPRRVEAALALLESRGLLVSGRLEDGSRRFVELELAREMRRATVARARRLASPAAPEAFARYLLARHGVIEGPAALPTEGDDAERIEAAIRRLAGHYATPRLLALVLAARLGRQALARLQAAAASGRVAWLLRPGGAGGGVTGGGATLFARDQGPVVAAASRAFPEGAAAFAFLTEPERAVADLLKSGGSWFAWEVARRLGMEESLAVASLLKLVRHGLVACEDPSLLWALMRSAHRPATAGTRQSHRPSPRPAGTAPPAFAASGWPAARAFGPAAYRRLSRARRRALAERIRRERLQGSPSANDAGPADFCAGRRARFWMAEGAATAGLDPGPGSAVPSVAPPPAASEPEAQEPAAAWALLLLERYGVVGPACAAADGCPLPWSQLADAFSRLEVLGRVVRGYFVEGLGGQQFALPDALEALRSRADEPVGSPARAVALALRDPANAWGRLFDPPPWWPAGTEGLVALVGGRPVMVLQAAAGGLWYDPQADPGSWDPALSALVALASAAWPGRRLVVRALQGEPPSARPEALARLLAAGFSRGPRTVEAWLGSA